MQYGRIWTDAKGESHVEWVDIDLQPVAGYAAGVPVIGVSPGRPASSVHFLQLEPGFSADWHPAPRRQLLIQLSGTVESELSDGTVEESGPGTMSLVEDTTGRGHRSHVVGDEPVAYAVVVLEVD